jgi:endoglucanase
MPTPHQRAQHLAWLSTITSLPTAAGHEQRVAEFITDWCAERSDLDLTRDSAGNLHVAFKPSSTPFREGRPIYFTAHMDHPAFVVERVISPTTLQLSFRGGVMDDYFKNATVLAHDSTNATLTGTLTGMVEAAGPFKHYTCELAASNNTLRVGDVVTWNVGSAEIIDNKMHTLACDDLAALAAALSAYDVLRDARAQGKQIHDTRLLFTRAEEIGFIGAIAAVKLTTMPMDARVIALENSRSFAESPIHGGPIVRVGDRVSVFSPTLTDAIAKRAEEIAGGASTVTASQKLKDLPPWKWQRKLMAGGACEASVFYNAGYEATCVCLPLGNYHNMADLDNVQAGTNTRPATIAREFIGVDDYHGLIDLLIACAEKLPEGTSKVTAMVEKLWNERSFVLTT